MCTRHLSGALIATIAAIAVSGCDIAYELSPQSVLVTTPDVEEAACKLTSGHFNAHGISGKVVRTPGTINLPTAYWRHQDGRQPGESWQDFFVRMRCVKEGYEDGVAVIEPHKGESSSISNWNYKYNGILQIPVPVNYDPSIAIPMVKKSEPSGEVEKPK